MQHRLPKHFWLPDVQAKEGGKTSHLTAAGNYVVDKQPTHIICAGDFWDIPSFSRHATNLEKEKRRFVKDIEAGVEAMRALLAPIEKYNRGRRKKYEPRKIFLAGNHEATIERYVNDHPELEGAISIDNLRLKEFGWEVYPFLKPVRVHGVYYAHYFYNQNNGKSYGGRAPNVLNSLGFSFTMGHKQGKDIASKELNNGKTIRGLIAGSYYQHNEKYKGPQGNDHWRGCIMKHEVRDGNYDLLELSLGYLLRDWT